MLTSADIIDWYAEEGRRAYGRIVPGRQKGVRQIVHAGAGRRRRRLHAVEFPDAHAGAQDRRRARGRLLDHHQGLGRNAGRLRRTGQMLRRCRRAGGRAQSGVRRAGGRVRAPDPVQDREEDFLHRLDPGRQASRRASPPRA